MANYSDKVIKGLEPEKIKMLKAWNKEFTSKFEEDELKTVLRLSESIDKLWKLTADERKRIEKETYEPLSVYGYDELGEGSHKSIREKDEIYKRLFKSEKAQNAGPYARLKAAMDYWCALWFWPIDKADLLPSRQEFFFDMSLILEGNIRAVNVNSSGQMVFQFEEDGSGLKYVTEGDRLALEFKAQYSQRIIHICEDDLSLFNSVFGDGTGNPKDEWVKVVQAQEVYDKVSYCKASRIGRGVRLDRKVRMQIWDVFDEYQNIMNEKLQRDVETAMYECRKILENKKLTGQYTSIIVDEGQDLSPSAYRLLRSLAGDEHRNDIFIVGDSHQRIYRNKAVLSKCGINVRGRSSYLRINYRTTEEIRRFAFGLLNGVSFDDLDDDYDNGKGCQSLTHGDKPEIKEFATPEEELDYLVSRIHELETAGVEQKNICIVARTHKLLDSYIAGLQRAGIKSFEIKANKTDDRIFEGVRIATMHRVKGLEFDHVFAVAVNKKVLPFGTRSDFEDDISLEEFRTGEKCLLYVALTRARKSACVTCYGGLSELIV